MTTLRRPFLILAVVLVLLAVLIEAFSLSFMSVRAAQAPDEPITSFGLAALAIFDGLLLLTLGLIAAPLLVSQEAVGRVQGVVTFVVACLIMGSAVAALIRAAVLLYLMFALLIVFIPYDVMWGSFPADKAGLALAALLMLKGAAAVCLVLAHPQFLSNKGLVLLMAVSIGLTILVSFLHSFPPRILASIGDVIASIVVLIVALLWAAVFALASLPAVKKAING